MQHLRGVMGRTTPSTSKTRTIGPKALGYDHNDMTTTSGCNFSSGLEWSNGSMHHLLFHVPWITVVYPRKPDLTGYTSLFSLFYFSFAMLFLILIDDPASFAVSGEDEGGGRIYFVDRKDDGCWEGLIGEAALEDTY